MVASLLFATFTVLFLLGAANEAKKDAMRAGVFFVFGGGCFFLTLMFLAMWILG